MSAPNILNITSIVGSIANVALSTTNATQIVSNSSSSNTVLKINAIIVANVNGSTAANITINIYSAAALGGTAYAIASTISVPANSSLVVLDKTASIYITENMSIGATAGTSNYLVVTCSYEVIS